jgi:hypothetical protein
MSEHLTSTSNTAVQPGMMGIFEAHQKVLANLSAMQATPVAAETVSTPITDEAHVTEPAVAEQVAATAGPQEKPRSRRMRRALAVGAVALATLAGVFGSNPFEKNSNKIASADTTQQLADSMGTPFYGNTEASTEVRDKGFVRGGNIASTVDHLNIDSKKDRVSTLKKHMGDNFKAELNNTANKMNAMPVSASLNEMIVAAGLAMASDNAEGNNYGKAAVNFNSKHNRAIDADTGMTAAQEEAFNKKVMTAKGTYRVQTMSGTFENGYMEDGGEISSVREQFNSEEILIRDTEEYGRLMFKVSRDSDGKLCLNLVKRVETEKASTPTTISQITISIPRERVNTVNTIKPLPQTEDTIEAQSPRPVVIPVVNKPADTPKPPEATPTPTPPAGEKPDDGLKPGNPEVPAEQQPGTPDVPGDTPAEPETPNTPVTPPATPETPPTPPPAEEKEDDGVLPGNPNVPADQDPGTPDVPGEAPAEPGTSPDTVPTQPQDPAPADPEDVPNSEENNLPPAEESEGPAEVDPIGTTPVEGTGNAPGQGQNGNVNPDSI